MTKQQIKKLVCVLLRHRPDLVIVKTASPDEKKTLVAILRKAGAKVVFRDEKTASEK